MIVIQPAGPQDIPLIQAIVQLTWPVTYGPILPQHQLDYMIGLIYSTAALQQQMKDGQRFLLATEKDNTAGFAAYSLEEKTATATRYKLNKLYVGPAQQGKGIGKILLDEVITQTKAAGATHLLLNVNRFNKARNFYEKLGFAIVKEEDVDIGNGYFMNDFVMEREIQ